MNEHFFPTVTVMLDKFASDLEVEMLYAGRGIVKLSSISVDRPGLRLAGFFSYFDTQRILVIGLTEHEYLRSFSSEERKEKIKKLFDCGEIPCVIFSRDLPVLPEFMEFARATATPIFRSSRLTTMVMADLVAYLSRLLAPTTTVHGVLMDVFGVGILITGSSGVGKSETSMELIKRGHRLVADDSVLIKRVSSGLVGTAPERIRYFMELRGIGIINVKNMYGSGSILDEKQVEVIMELEHWQRDKQYDRIGGAHRRNFGRQSAKTCRARQPRAQSFHPHRSRRPQPAPQKHGLRRGAGTHPTHHRQMKQELLAPAGDIACAKAALAAGADAIYLGLPAFSARAGAGNFALSEFSETVRLAHLLGAKVYVCLNTLVKDGETDAFFESALTAWNLGADALLIQDIFLGKELKRRYPSMVLHLSTQAGCCNVYGAELAKEYGFSRVVLARETPLGDIAAISAVIETEAFVQGALCSCFSGQCYFSSFAGNNSGNRGRCKQPCRKLYSIDRAGFEERAYALSLSDLSVGERVKELLQAGVTSLKIEGRMRREEYVSAAVGYYRALLDGAEKSELLAARSALARTFDRGDYTEGLAFGQENLLSRNVQGHIGERVGVLEVKGGRYFCRGSARKGDGFKILRGGKEAGGAVCASADERGFYLSSESRLRAGDEVRITTDTALKEALLKKERRREVKLSLRFAAGEPPNLPVRSARRFPRKSSKPASKRRTRCLFL